MTDPDKIGQTLHPSATDVDARLSLKSHRGLVNQAEPSLLGSVEGYSMKKVKPAS